MMQGRTDVGIAMLRDGVTMVGRTGAAIMRPSYLGMLAAADLLDGDRNSAASRLDEALEHAERTGERLNVVGLLIEKSHLLAEAVPSGVSSRPAEDCLRQALDVAHAQGARLLQLRAALALARHCVANGRAAEGRKVLTAAYAPFAGRRLQAPEIAATERLLAELSN
jgi:hypothetical protein